jgi:RimJ/RimL family protein N-acetyltransferase
MRLAFAVSRETFAAVTDLHLPGDWPQFPEAFAPRVGPVQLPPWAGYLFVYRDSPTLIGNGGFVAPPDAEGIVEIGYEVAPEHQNLGYGTEAAQTLIELAFANGAKAVIAHTLAWPNASTTLLQKVGMRFERQLVDSEHAAIWRWQIAKG